VSEEENGKRTNRNVSRLKMTEKSNAGIQRRWSREATKLRSWRDDPKLFVDGDKLLRLAARLLEQGLRGGLGGGEEGTRGRRKSGGWLEQRLNGTARPDGAAQPPESRVD
jgi:hypothetical protein